MYNLKKNNDTCTLVSTIQAKKLGHCSATKVL